MKDLHGKAILDYFHGDQSTGLTIHNNYDTPEEMPAEVFFRDELDFTTLEHLALIECKGKVLDLGAGAGAHSLVLQEREFDVTAIENSPGCIEVMQQLGVKNSIHEDFKKHYGTYDTILILMNGLGLAGTLAQVPDFLSECLRLLAAEGQILIDSSDITYLYQGGIKPPSSYSGDVKYQYEYKGQKGDWFDWVYVDIPTLEQITNRLNLELEILLEDENDQYLARISRS